MIPARIAPTLSRIDRRYGDDAELMLRIAIVAMESKVDGIGVSELRRLLGYPGAMLDRMDRAAFAELVERSDACRGTALMIARDPRAVRRHAASLRTAVERARVDAGLPAAFRIEG